MHSKVPCGSDPTEEIQVLRQTQELLPFPLAEEETVKIPPPFLS